MPILPDVNVIIAFAFGLLLLYIIGRVLLRSLFWLYDRNQCGYRFDCWLSWPTGGYLVNYF
ncbi:MAG: hypothetical protein K0Q77_2682 [Anaerosporomusa subterranea]|nr:hypothetical protein [Anaerosporomusa subterranea]